MFRLAPESSGYLFASRELRQVTEGIHAQIGRDVDALEPNRLLNTAPADLVSYFVEKYRINPIILHRDRMAAEGSEVRVDISRDRERVFLEEDRGPHYIPGQRIQVAVPFEGDAELFYCRPSTFTSPSSRGVIENATLVLSWEMPHDTARGLKPEIEQALGEIEQWLTWIRRDVDTFNASLPQIATEAIESRRKRLFENQGRLSSLGIPLKARADAPSTYATPTVRKKVVPKLPAASSAAYMPESVLDDELYEHILKVVQNMAHVMERSPSAFAAMDEESLRQHFLVQLNGHFEGQATGETFNASGKTDILLRSGDRNVFIAECKFWRGPKEFHEAIDQLLSYASWRDTKTAVLVFNRGTTTSTVLAGIRQVAEKHPNYKRKMPWSHESGFRFVFHHPGDSNRELVITVLVFDVPTPSA